MKSPLFPLVKLTFSLKKTLYRRILSTNSPISCGKIKQPTLFLGKGAIRVAKTARLGYFPSPHFYSGYMHVEARSRDSEISVGERTFINNNAVLIAERGKISIGSRCFIGSNFQCVSSDFHGLDPRNRDDYKSADVRIGDDVFIGNDVTILKGVSIGGGATIAAGAVVTKSFPENALIGGNPAKLIRILSNHEHADVHP